MDFLRRATFWGGLLAGILVVVVIGLVAFRSSPTEASDLDYAAQPEEAPASAETLNRPLDVEVIHPRTDLPFVIEIQEPADIEAFYRADLKALVAGVVKSVPKAIGNPVTKDEVLVKIDVPDRVVDVLEKDAIVDQRLQDVAMAIERAKSAAAGVNAYRENVKLKEANQQQAEAERAYRQFELNRYRGLARDRVVTQDVVDEKVKWTQAAQAASIGARVDVEKAKADLEEMQAKFNTAKADISLKQSLVRVAHKDRDRAQALLEYATIRAPFDGYIIKRNVDPGDFAQNSATGVTPALLSVVRTDIVTVVMKVPDSYAPYVSTDTDAVIQLPGRLIKAKVTRFSPSIHEQDRTMRVEVDLFNGGRDEYSKFLARGVSSFLPVNPANPLTAMTALAAGKSLWGDNMKGSLDPFPCFPDPSTGGALTGQAQRLLPRMYGQMKLLLKQFHNSHLIPNEAIFSVGGKKYVLLAEKGRARQVAVNIMVSDPRLARVGLIEVRPTEAGNVEEIKDLTGKESIIFAHQGEIHDGQKVNPRVVSWPARPAAKATSR